MPVSHCYVHGVYVYVYVCVSLPFVLLMVETLKRKGPLMKMAAREKKMAGRRLRWLFALALLRVADGIACSPGCPVVLPNGTHCGFRTGRECPRPFSVAEILESSRQWGVAHNAALNEQAHRTAAAACASTGEFKSLQSGGWCLRPDAHLKAGIIGHLPAKTEVVAALDALLKGDGTAPRFSLGDFGAGIGQYGHALKALDPRHTYRGFDGAGNIENVTERFVRFADLTLPVTLPVSDFVLSLEVRDAPIAGAERQRRPATRDCGPRPPCFPASDHLVMFTSPIAGG
jgi:hypothetical protein